MSVIKHTLLAIPALIMLSACGGGDCAPDGSQPQGDPNAPDNCGAVGGAYNIAISYPNTNAIEQLTNSPGFYSYRGSVTVVDQNGNPPPDGTIVQLDAIDTIFATGQIDSLTTTVLNDANPTLTDGTATDFVTAGVFRNNGAYRFIETNDLVLLRNAERIDQYRSVAATPTANNITVNAPYSITYPNTVYTGANATRYYVGQSVVGVKITGIDHDNGDAPLAGYTKTVNGIGDFRLEYPANDSTIFMGCSDDVANGYINGSGLERMDYRHFPYNSADVAVIAKLNGTTSVTAVDWQGCFAAIAPATISSGAAALALGANIVTITITDANAIGLPYISITGNSSDNAVAQLVDQDAGTVGTQACMADATNGEFRTQPGGSCNIQINAIAAGTATITLNGGGATATIAVSI